MNTLNLDWRLLKNKEYPKQGEKILIYLVILNDWRDPKLGYYKYITESKMTKENKKRKWEANFFDYDEKNIIAWAYFEYPNFELE
jgi:hypothetical protein